MNRIKVVCEIVYNDVNKNCFYQLLYHIFSEFTYSENVVF